MPMKKRSLKDDNFQKRPCELRITARKKLSYKHGVAARQHTTTKAVRFP
jgi:hypothetical protein